MKLNHLGKITQRVVVLTWWPVLSSFDQVCVMQGDWQQPLTWPGKTLYEYVLVFSFPIRYTGDAASQQQFPHAAYSGKGETQRSKSFQVSFLELQSHSIHIRPLFSSTSTSKKLLQYLSHRMFAARAWSIKCRRKEKLIAQFGGKLRDERFESN